MFRFFCKNLVQNFSRVNSSTRNHARLLQTLSLNSSSNISNSKIENTPTVSYLVNSCGLSLDSAVSASKKVQIDTTEKPDSVLHLFRSYGFTNAQITSLITRRPQFILCDPDKTLKPKIEFLESLGFSRSGLANLICSDATILFRSLRKQIIPTVNYFKSFVHTNENLVTCLKQCSYILCVSLHLYVEPNISTLRAHGVPDSIIAKLLLLQANSLLLPSDKFKEVVKTVEEMGFDPQSRSFALALRSISRITKPIWERKVEALKSFGWSDEDILEAFKLQPGYMATSEMKIKKLMEFYVNALGLKSSDVVRRPNYLLVSLEKRVIPRCSVLEVLVANKLVERKNLNLLNALVLAKADFEKRFVTKYQLMYPEIVKAYQGEMGYPRLDALRRVS